MKQQHECNHTPPCQLTCRVCDCELPEYKEFPPTGPDKIFVVHFEKGIKHTVPAASEEQAIDIASVGSARAAGLCLDHMVRFIKVETSEGASWERNFQQKKN